MTASRHSAAQAPVWVRTRRLSLASAVPAGTPAIVRSGDEKTFASLKVPDTPSSQL